MITDVSHRGYVKQALRVLEDQELKNLIQQRLSEGAYHALYGSVKNACAALPYPSLGLPRSRSSATRC